LALQKTDNNNNNSICIAHKVRRYRGAGGIRLRLSEQMGLEVSFKGTAQTSAKANQVSLRTPDPDDLYTSRRKLWWRSDQIYQRSEPNCGKNALSRNVEESFKDS